MLQIHQYLEQEGKAIFFDTENPEVYFYITALGSRIETNKNDIAVTTRGAFSSHMCEPLDYNGNGPTFSTLKELKTWIIEHRTRAHEPGSTYEDARKFLGNLGLDGWKKYLEEISDDLRRGNFSGKIKLLGEFATFPVVSNDAVLSKMLSDLQKIAALEKYITAPSIQR